MSINLSFGLEAGPLNPQITQVYPRPIVSERNYEKRGKTIYNDRPRRNSKGLNYSSTKNK
jgi:hypothetical protein